MYDLQITFSDNAIWFIDVKAYRNPHNLKYHILNSGGFPPGRYERGYYAIPKQYVPAGSDYLQIVRSALNNLPKDHNVDCLSIDSLKKEIIEKERCVRV